MQNLQQSICTGLSFFNKIAGSNPSTLLQKKTLAHMFSYEFCKSFKNTFFHRTSPLAASVYSTSIFKVIRNILKRGSQRGDDIHRLRWRNLITPDSSPKGKAWINGFFRERRNKSTYHQTLQNIRVSDRQDHCRYMIT